MTILIFFILGLIVGSFLNVVISRLRTAETILGHSHCPRCKARIRWYDNIPLFSFAILGTRCRDCKEKISWQYPSVELAAGILFALVGNYFFAAADLQSWLMTIFYLVVFSLLLVIFAYDFKFMEIPMIILWIGIIWTIASYLLFDWLNFIPREGILSIKLYSGILAGFSAFLFFFVLSAGSREKWMGIGDAYVGLLAGLIVGWPAILPALAIAFTLGAVSGLILIALKKKTMKSQVPFAPFLAAGTILVILIPKIFPEVNHWLLIF